MNLTSEDIACFDWSTLPLHERLESHDLAFQSVEAVYELLASAGRIPRKVLCHLYKSTHVERAFKKQILTELQIYYESIYLIHHLESTKRINITFLPSQSWLKVDRWLSASNPVHHDGFRPLSASKIVRLPSGRLMRHVASLLKIISVPFHVISRVRRLRFRTHPKQVNLAVRVFENDFGVSKFKNKRIDWMINGSTVKREDTLFIADTDLSAEYKEALKGQHYHCLDWSRQEAFKLVSVGFLLRTLLPSLFFYMPRVLAESIRAPIEFKEIAADALVDYLRWSALLEFWHPRAHLAYNDISIHHIFRNLILERAGCVTYFYQHTNSTYRLYEYKTKVSGRHCDWAYNFFSREAHISNLQVGLSVDQRSHSQMRLAYGPFWSSVTTGNREFKDILLEKWPDFYDRNSIAIFNTTFYPAGPNRAINGAVVHKEFLLGILDILEAPLTADNYLVIRSKKPFSQYFESEDSELVMVARKIFSHPNVLVVDREFDAGAIIGEVRLTLTMSYASPSIESLLAGRKALFFDPTKEYPRGYFRRLPDFVAYGREQLIEKIRHWQNMGQEDLEKFIEFYVAEEFGGRPGVSPIEKFQADIAELFAV